MGKKEISTNLRQIIVAMDMKSAHQCPKKQDIQTMLLSRLIV